jgi:small subunit ribosomal protein S2
MIIRRAICASSRALARKAPRRQLQVRHVTTETESIATSAENSLKQLQSIHAQLSAQGDEHVPAVDPETHGTASSVTDHVAEQYHIFKEQG